MNDRLAFARELQHQIGRYHDEDGVDRRYAKAVRLLRHADAEIALLNQRQLGPELYENLAAMANHDPRTGSYWLPLPTVRYVLDPEGHAAWMAATDPSPGRSGAESITQDVSSVRGVGDE